MGLYDRCGWWEGVREVEVGGGRGRRSQERKGRGESIEGKE